MANTQAQFGFQHFGYSPGGAVDYQLSKYQIRSAYASAIYFGDPVIKSASTQYIQLSIGTGGGAAGTTISGIFYGCQYTPTGGIPTWAPWFPGTGVGADATAYVMDAPNALFRVAALLTPIPATAMGNCIGYSTGAGGTTVGGGFSTYVVDQSIMNTTAAFQLVSFYPGLGNGSDSTTNYNWVIVAFNTQRYKSSGTTGVA